MSVKINNCNFSRINYEVEYILIKYFNNDIIRIIYPDI